MCFPLFVASPNVKGCTGYNETECDVRRLGDSEGKVAFLFEIPTSCSSRQHERLNELLYPPKLFSICGK